MEIERKYLITHIPFDIAGYPFHQIEQAYLSTAPVVRVRQEDDTYYLTYKSKGLMAREEYNLPLTKESYEHLRSKADGRILTKKRYLIPMEGTEYTIELDIFLGEYEGLKLAEVEFPSEEAAHAFVPPEWFGREVTFTGEYQNSRLALAEKLATVAPQASLDNHKLWLNKLINFASGLKMLALSVLALVIGITSGAIFYSTQTSLGLHKDIIEILHLLGAKDTYIAQQYAAKTAVLGFWGGLIGVVFAVPTIFVIAHLAQQIEGGIINEARLSWGAWTVIFSLPLFSMLVAMQTAYYTVKRTLEKMM